MKHMILDFGIKDWAVHIIFPMIYCIGKSFPERREMMADYITTYTKEHFTPLDPQSSQIHLRDIAHALSMLTRANGHFPEFYSVGQHSIQCCREAMARGYSQRIALACLLHDASEAYLSDVTRPVKKNIKEYRRIEQRLQDAIYRKYMKSGLTEKETALVKLIDDVCLYYEFRHYMGEELQTRPQEMASQPAFYIRSFLEVEQEFMTLAGMLLPV